MTQRFNNYIPARIRMMMPPNPLVHNYNVSIQEDRNYFLMRDARNIVVDGLAELKERETAIIIRSKS
jgi:hypothetical protein